MQKFDLLTSLPSTLSCITLQEWLGLKSVMRLDSAYCSNSYRKDVLELLQSDEYFIREQETIEINTSLHCKVVVMLRRFGEKMRSVQLVDKRHRWIFEKPVHISLVLQHCHHLTHIEFSCLEVCTPELWTLLRTNPHIECLVVSSYEKAMISTFNSSFDGIVLPKLKTLVVTNYNIVNKNVLGAMKLGNIARLNLSSCCSAGSIFLQIAALCPQLTVAVLSNFYIREFTDELLNKFMTLCPHILHLDLSNAIWVTDAGMFCVVKNLKGLQSLKFTDTSQLTDASLVHIYTHCADTLQTFVFGYNGNNTAFSADTINTLLERCTKLRTVHLKDRCNGAKLLVFSSTTIGNLTRLAIGGSSVCDQNLAIISTHAKYLEVLEIDSQYEYNTIIDLVNTFPHLKKFSYNLCCKVDPLLSIPDILTPAYWKNIRPGISVTLTNEWQFYWEPTKPDVFDF